MTFGRIVMLQIHGRVVIVDLTFTVPVHAVGIYLPGIRKTRGFVVRCVPP